MQEIRADKKREARFMKKQVKWRRGLRKSWEAGILDMAKALEKRGMATSDIVATIADVQNISQTEAQKYCDRLVVTS